MYRFFYEPVATAMGGQLRIIFELPELFDKLLIKVK